MSVLGRMGRLARTLRHVPPRMLLARLGYSLRCRYYSSPVYGLFPPSRPISQGLKIVPPDLWGGDVVQAKALSGGVFTFTGASLPLGLPPRTWFPERASALWVFHLHYHDWLGDLRAAGEGARARALVEDWIQQCGHWHAVAWHPYPLSLRIVNWLTHGSWLLAGEGVSEGFRQAFWEVLSAQVTHLRANLERGLEGNHLIKNLKALVYAGACLPGQEHLLMDGLQGLLHGLKQQVYTDGGHYEATPTYHAQVLRDVVDMVALLRKAGGVPPYLGETMERMASVLAFYRHPDGGLALFNDGEVGDPKAIARLLKQAGGAGEIPVGLPQTGYVRLVRGPMVAFLDAGKVGPDENPGHAHADALSFELSVGEERVIVNSGTYGYQHPKRNQMRGTAMKATVQVAGEDSAEVWAVFRVGRRPREIGFEVQERPGSEVVVRAWHDGYRHLNVRHMRKLVMAADGSMLRGEDEVTGPAGRVVAGFPLATGVNCRLEREDLALLTTPGGRKLTLSVRGGRLDVRDSQYAPHFGVWEANRMLLLRAAPLRDGMAARLEWLIQVKEP